jgi:excisionase family DNA binding protein
MASAVPTTMPAPRFGSAARMATYSGLSVKTIRRLVDAGKVRGMKVGRRLLIPYEDLDRHILRISDHRPRPQEAPTMAIAPTPVSPRSSVDAHGRAIPMTEAEVRARAGAITRGLDALDDMGDADEQRESLDALLAALEEDRLSDRKLFP